jgi:hypothetical protein
MNECLAVINKYYMFTYAQRDGKYLKKYVGVHFLAKINLGS